jgi:hypothetical protein
MVERDLRGEHDLDVGGLGVRRGRQDGLLVAVGDRGEVGEAGAHLEDAGVRLRETLHVARHLGARPDEAHVADEDVPELGQLVELEAAEHAADAGDARVAAGRHLGPARRLPHRAELQDAERPPAPAGADLPEEHRAGRRQLHRDRRGGEHRPEEHEPRRGRGDVHGSLREAVAEPTVGALRGARRRRSHFERRGCLR